MPNKIATDFAKEFLGANPETQCPFCKEPGPFKFNDALSLAEFQISGICQVCQDDFFDPPEPELEDDKSYW